MFSNILGGAAGFPVADLGDEISQSLRFRGSQRLRGDFASTEWTISSWVKLAVRIDQVDYIWSAGTSGIAINSSAVTWFDGSNFTSSTALLRDPSAWYHIVANKDTVYLNGQTLMSITGINLSATANNFNVGAFSTNTLHLNGYQASFIAIDGQKLDPTAFGRYQEDGVWVPKNYTGTYGTNGFRLDFADSSDLGNDVSGNNNDFTASGFDTADVALYSKDLFTSTSSSINVNSTSTGFDSVSFPPSNAFDGSTSTQCTTNSATDTAIIFRPSTAITNVTQIEVTAHPTTAITDLVGGFNGTGNEANITSTGYQEIYNGSAITLNNLYVRTTSGQAALCAIRINGSTVLIDNFDNDVDYNDTPTSNYATFNPLLPTNGTLSNANLQRTGTTSGYALKPSTIGLDTNGNYYFEYLPTANDITQVGITNENQNFDDQTQMVTAGIGLANSSGGTSSIIQNGTATQTGLTAFDDGDIVGVQLDGATVRFFINGTQVGTDETVVPGDYVAAVSDNSGGTSSDGSINFGQQPFLYQPAGTVALQTNNLPEPTIKNGKEHFEAVIYTGNNSSSGQAITGLEFAPDFVWIKARTRSDNHSLQNTITGVGSVLRSNSSNDESTTAALSSFDSNGFTLSGNDPAWNGSENYVAWCWKAGGTAVSNTDGTNSSTVNVSANEDGGFSIVTYTGETSNSPNTIGHGLNAIPEFIIVKRRDAIDNWAVYHVSVGNDRTLELHDSTAQSGSSSAYWNSTTPTSSVFSVGNGGATNEAGGNYVAYVWAPKEGFSKFGSYTANNDADGPFIYLGFKPAFILIKSATHVTNWHLYDSARDPVNRENKFILNPNAQNVEKDDADERLDFLSNGFKLRSVDNDNVGSNTYVYAAFAESPFGGENTAPATAR